MSFAHIQTLGSNKDGLSSTQFVIISIKLSKVPTMYVKVSTMLIPTKSSVPTKYYRPLFHRLPENAWQISNKITFNIMRLELQYLFCFYVR